MTKQELLEIAAEFRDIAINAVGHVGYANYAEREREALRWVREASDKLNEALGGLKP